MCRYSQELLLTRPTYLAIRGVDEQLNHRVPTDYYLKLIIGIARGKKGGEARREGKTKMQKRYQSR
jgi:tmRNA-binding protein